MPKIIRIPRRTTDAQRAAARANGARSHGPVTDEGKAKAAMNALRHGLTSATLVLTTEEKTRFDELLGEYIDEYEPATQTERDLVQEIAVSKWLQRRCWALQTALLNVTMDRMDDEVRQEFSEIPNSTRTALAFARQAGADGALALLNRYAGRHSREWHKAIDKLRAIQKERTRGAAIPGCVPGSAGASPSNLNESTQNPERERGESAVSPNEPGQASTPIAAIACMASQPRKKRNGPEF